MTAEEMAPIADTYGHAGYERIVRQFMPHKADWMLAVQSNNPTAYTWVAAIAENNREEFPRPYDPPIDDGPAGRWPTGEGKT